MTEKSLNIYQRISEVMKDISYVQKEDKKVNNQYRFVSHDAVTAKVRPFLVKHGIVVMPSVISSALTGNMTSATMEVTFINIDDPQDRVTINTFGYGVDPQDKGPGKAMSYAYKYALLKALALETGDDPERDSVDADLDIGSYTQAEKAEFDKYIKDSDALGFECYLRTLPVQTLTALCGSFPKGVKGKMAATVKELASRGEDLVMDYVLQIEEAEDDEKIKELVEELRPTEKKHIWTKLTPQAQDYLITLKDK